MNNTRIFLSNDEGNNFQVAKKYDDVFLEDGLPHAALIDDCLSNKPQVVHAVNVTSPVIHYNEPPRCYVQCSWSIYIAIAITIAMIGLFTAGICSIAKCWRV